MSLEIVFVLCVIALCVALFASEKLPVDLVALLGMAALLLSGVVTPEQGISGFSNSATVTVAAMFILSAGLIRTGAIRSLSALTSRAFRINVWLGLFAVMMLAGFLSAFANNTPVVAIFIPVLLGVARDIKHSPSRFLMPLSFASMFGGLCTLIGTSTNILISSIAVRSGLEPFTMFEFAPLGIVLFVAGTMYMLLIGVRLLPNQPVGEELTDQFGMGFYITEIRVLPGARTVGKTVRQSPLVMEAGVEILEIIRDGERIPFASRRIVIREGDVLRVVGDVEIIRGLQNQEGIELVARASFSDAEIAPEDTLLIEAIVAPNGRLDGKTLKESRFSETYGVTALAIRHRGQTTRTNTSTTRLRGGDALLLEVYKESMDTLRAEDAFVFVTEAGVQPFRTKKAFIAVAITLTVVASAAMGLVPIVVGAITGGVLLVLTRCLTLEEAYGAVEWKVIFLLAGALTLGVALESSGAAKILSQQIVDLVGPWGPSFVLATFYLLTTVLTNVMSNNATAALIAPIAIGAAHALQIDPVPLLMAVTFAASSSFMTPVGYQTNAMIYDAGQYRFRDFLVVGTPLNLLFMIISTLLIPVFWQF